MRELPDAPSAIALAGSYDVPIGVTSPCELYRRTFTQLRLLGDSRIMVVSSESAASPRMEKEIVGIVGDVS